MEIVEEIKKALEYTKQRKYKKAETIYKELLKKDPQNESVISFLGLLYFNQMNYKKAEKYLEKAYQLANSPTVLSYVGITKFLLTKYKAAIPYLEEALIQEKKPEIYRALVISCAFSRQNEKCYNYAIEAHKLYPFDETILRELSYICIVRGFFNDAILYSQKLFKLNPKSADFWFNTGLLNEILYNNEEKARECYRKMAKCGDKSGSYLNLAISYAKDSKYRKKVYYYLKQTEKFNPNKIGLNFMFASYYLSRRKFKRGYKYYIIPNISSQDDKDWYSRFKNPWKGESSLSNTLFVYGDQGLGDQIQFIRYLPDISKKFKKLKIMVKPSLIKLFSQTFPEYEFYPADKNFPRYDKYLFLAQAPYYLNKRFNNIPLTNGYLKTDNKKVQEYKSKYFNTEKIKIGICWEAGATGLRDQIHRTLNIELFEQIIQLNKAKVYSFQVNPSLDNYKKYKNLTDLGETFSDFDDTAAALKNIDLLITVDTSIAHLAGALGIKTFLILPYCSDWRWFDNTETTEWYDSVKIFKQNINETWDKVFERLYDSICTLT